MGALMSAGESDGGGDLVEQRLEDVVVAAVDERARRPARSASALAAARPAKPPPTMNTLGSDFDVIGRTSSEHDN